MKSLTFGLATTIIILTACNNNTGASKINNDSVKVKTEPANASDASNMADTKVDGPIKEIVGQYLRIKNALANDDSKGAATAGNDFIVSMGKMDTTLIPVVKRNAWDDLSDDAKEMAAHIGANAGKMEHQREHFDMLSNDMYDLVKAFGSSQTLYKEFCPMYNEKKGASWLSESKEIKNPYMGKKMSGCGIIKEEIK